MGKRVYRLTRDLHLYIGLFLSPFVLVFAVSVFPLVHPARTRPADPARMRTVADLPVPDGIEQLNGRPLAEALRPLLDRAGVSGEIGFVRKIADRHRIVVPVEVPGRVTEVDLDVAARSAVTSERNLGMTQALIYLHKMPGPHNAAIRGNAAFMRVWRVLADVAGYGVLFLTLSGSYLWAVLKAERRIGLVLMSLGAVTFFGVVYAIAR
jgi:hypothetical protein